MDELLSGRKRMDGENRLSRSSCHVILRRIPPPLFFFFERTASMHAFFQTPLRFIISTLFNQSILPRPYLTHPCTCPMFHLLVRYPSISTERIHAIVRGIRISMARSYTPLSLPFGSRADLLRHGQTDRAGYEIEWNGMERKAFMHARNK